ncbi:hypothetical protein GCM10010245_91160 [Streptomyces spectabilis]|nr:hypothetical protein GCM10010245_91160 [Streptomyces spectabilis]
MLADRVQQARVKNALEPEWEARFEPRSYGFRPGRGCHEAIEVIFKTLCGNRSKRRWILDADLAGSFDRIDHDHLLDSLGTFPARGMVRAWLKAGVMESGEFTPTDEGTPQGGVTSPMLNVALHGMEHAVGVRYRPSVRSDAETVKGCPVLVRYADDYVAMCHSREQAEQVKASLTAWLEPRGLRFNEDKTRIVHVEDGFSFLGFDIRRRIDRQGSGKLLITPSKESVKRFRKRLTADVRSMHGANAAAVLSGSTRLSGDGRPTTGAWSPAGASPAWTTMSGISSTGGPDVRIRTSRGVGSRPGTSPSSTSPGKTGGCSASATAAPTSPSSPGRRSSGMSRSTAEHLRMTLPWPSTGPNGGARRRPRPWTSTPPGFFEAKADAVLHAGNSCCTPSRSHAAHASGSSSS